MMEYLLDDYLLLYLRQGEKKYLEAAINKLIRCGFNEKTALDIINVEIEIIKYRSNIPNSILNKLYWLDKIELFEKDESFRVFDDDINKYVMLRYDRPTSAISHYTLTLSELCGLFDEAWSICNRFKYIVPKNMLNECLTIAKSESMDSWVIREFKTRIEGIFRDVNNIDTDYNHLVANKEINNLYDEEFKILVSQRKFNQFDEKA